MDKLIQRLTRNNLILFTLFLLFTAFMVMLGSSKGITINPGNLGRAGVTTQKCQTASSSPTFVTTTASSTCQIDIENAEQASVFMCFTASTTAAQARWTYSFTNDEADSRTNFFRVGESEATSTNVMQIGTYRTTYTWTPANASASSTCATVGTLKNLGARYLNINYSTGSANGAYYIEVSKKQN